MLVTDEAAELAAQLRSDNPLVEGIIRGLAEMDELIGGADTWDDTPGCDGVAFAITTHDLGSEVAVGLIPLVELSDRIHAEAERDQAPGLVGRAISRVVLNVRAGGYTPDLTALIHEPNCVVTAMGFAAEAHGMTSQKEESFAAQGLFIKDQPGAFELRFAMAVDFAGVLTLHSRVRGEQPKVGIVRGRERREVAGPIPRALQILMETMRTPAYATEN